MDSIPTTETLQFTPFFHADIQPEAAISPPPPHRPGKRGLRVPVVKQPERGAISHTQRQDLTSMYEIHVNKQINSFSASHST
jgi:hypothetical protein